MASSDLPRLFTKIQRKTQRVAALAVENPGASFERIQMDTAVLGFGDFAVETETGVHIASRIDSYRRDDGDETVIFRVGNEPLSVVTTFSGRPAYGHVAVDGTMYFISPEGDHYVMTPSTTRDLPPDTVHPPRHAAFAAERRRARLLIIAP